MKMERVALRSQKDLNSVKRGMLVESQNDDLLKKAAAKGVFVNPLGYDKFFRDDVLVKAVSEGESVFTIPLSVLLRSKGASRAKLLSRLRIFSRLCMKKRAKLVFTNAYAEGKFDLKGEREASALGVLLGFTQRQSKEMLV